VQDVGVLSSWQSNAESKKETTSSMHREPAGKGHMMSFLSFSLFPLSNEDIQLVNAFELFGSLRRALQI